MTIASKRIEHVVVLMLENRSFDHMLGLMPGVDGLLVDGKIGSAYVNREKPADPESQAWPACSGAPYAIVPEDIDRAGFGGPAHSFPAATLQLYGSENPPTPEQLAKPTPLDGFIRSYLNELAHDVHRNDPAPSEVRVPLAAFEDGRLPVLWTLAREFCVCDRWFSEVPGPTQPNRLFVHAATSTGFAHNVWAHPIEARTVYDALERAGHDWAFFYYDLSDSNCFPQLKSRIDRVLPFSAFFQQAGAGSLPSYSFLCPRYADAPDGRANSQHAPYDVRYGEHLVADVYESLRQGPAWERTLLVVTYDEHGGFYDHVSPPTANVSNPDGLTSPTAQDRADAERDPHRNGYLLDAKNSFDFRRLGLRVPTLLVSPWIRRGTVDSTQYQHTSILATLRDLFGVESLTARDREARSFASLLEQLDSPRDAPARLERPSLPDAPPPASAMSQPLTERQRDLWPILSHLDGHPDSGRSPEPPATRAAAHAYIRERWAAHHAYHRQRRRRAAFEIHGDARQGYGWRLRSPEGDVVASSATTAATREEIERQIAVLRDVAPFARAADAHGHFDPRA